jgi:hypothetical protein
MKIETFKFHAVSSENQHFEQIVLLDVDILKPKDMFDEWKERISILQEVKIEKSLMTNLSKQYSKHPYAFYSMTFISYRINGSCVPYTPVFIHQNF